MKFGAQLEANIAEEWRSHYVRYKQIKKLISSLFPKGFRKIKRKKALNGLKSRSYGSLENGHARLSRSELKQAHDDPLHPNEQEEDEEEGEGEEGEGEGEGEEQPEEERGFLNYHSDDIAFRATEYGTPREPERSVRERCETIVVELVKDLDEVDTWYQTVEKQLIGSFEALKQQMAHQPPLSEATSKEARTLKESFQHLLRKETLLVNFVALNTMAFEKLLKNFEKRADVLVREEFMREVKARHFASSRTVDEQLMPATFQLYAHYFEHGSLQNAQAHLLGKISDAEYSRRDAFFFGLKFGLMLFLGAYLLLHILTSPYPSAYPWEPTHDHNTPTSTVLDRDRDMFFAVYRLTGLALLCVWLWGGSVWVWSKFRVPYVFVMEFNPRTRLSHFQIFQEAVNLSIVWLVNLLLLIVHNATFLDDQLSTVVYPLSLFAFFVLKLFVPFAPFNYWTSRYCLLESLYNVFISPFGRVRFRDMFVADTLTSMPKPLTDFFLAAAFYLSGTWMADENAQSSNHTLSISIVVPFLCLLPLWCRAWQCLRKAYDLRAESNAGSERWEHVGNALKHVFAAGVVLAGALHPHWGNIINQRHPLRIAWLVCCVVTAVAFFLWDVVVDWGLFAFDRDSNHPLLRKTLMYHRPLYYYLAIALDFVLRFAWLVLLVPFPFSSFHALLGTNRLAVLPALLVAESVRRFMWGLFAVEYEYVKRSSRLRSSQGFLPVVMLENQDTSDKRRQNTVTGYGMLVEVLMMVLLILAVNGLGYLALA